MSEQKFPAKKRGRAARDNPASPFAPWHLVRSHDDLGEEEEASREQTLFFRDHPRSILSRNRSPDLPFDYSLNPYRGCEHGCAYCYAREYHEYLGFSAGLDFETRIVIKEEAPRLLRKQLSKTSWQPQTIFFSGGTDCYQPIERQLRITRRCLEVLRDFRNPVSIITKNHLVTRDLDLLAELASYQASQVWISMISLDRDLIRKLEPRTSSPEHRLAAIQTLSQAGVPVGVMVAPILPGLTEHEVPAIVKAASEAGARFATCSRLRLPGRVQEVFQTWVEAEFPERSGKILGGLRQEAEAESLRALGEQLFQQAIARLGLAQEPPRLSAASFRDPEGRQLQLFETPS